jgi:hypothetical protein
MDPDAPRPVRNRSAESRSLTNVQRWVMSVLAVSTILHLSLGLVLATQVVENPQAGAAEGLCVLAGAFGVIAVGTGLAIHGRPILSPWLALGIIPTLLGFWYIS